MSRLFRVPTRGMTFFLRRVVGQEGVELDLDEEAVLAVPDLQIDFLISVQGYGQGRITLLGKLEPVFRGSPRSAWYFQGVEAGRFGGILNLWQQLNPGGAEAHGARRKSCDSSHYISSHCISSLQRDEWGPPLGCCADELE